MPKLGKVNKPEISKYKDKKKIYFVKNLYLPQNATKEYKAIFFRYWDEVKEHLAKLEAAGKVSKIFCESIYMSGEESMKVINSMNTRLEKIIKDKIDAGGEMIPLEDKEIFGAYVDWNNCLMLVRTPGVYEKIHDFFKETIENRFKHIRSVLKENIKDAEAGLLIMRDGDQELLKLPDDIEFFYITPPAYEDLRQFISDSTSGKEYWRS
ncbi:MAG: hypothetical protein ABFR82_10995 [Nitrospirota bacterium]